MLCENSDKCIFYSTYRYKARSKQYNLLIESYCEGHLHAMCRRRLFANEFDSRIPDDLAPNGYLAGTHQKVRIENTRKHKRYKIHSGDCLLQEPLENKTFSAGVVDISEGGLKLEVNIDPKELNINQQTGFLKILGHTIRDSPFPFTQESIEIVWRNKQFIGCSFTPTPA